MLMMNKKIRQQWGGEFKSSWNGWRVFVDKNIFEAGRGYMYLGRRVPIAGQRMDTSLIFIDSTAPSWLKEQLELIAKRTDIDTPAHRTMWLLDIFAQAEEHGVTVYESAHAQYDDHPVLVSRSHADYWSFVYPGYPGKDIADWNEWKRYVYVPAGIKSYHLAFDSLVRPDTIFRNQSNGRLFEITYSAKQQRYIRCRLTTRLSPACTSYLRSLYGKDFLRNF